MLRCRPLFMIWSNLYLLPCFSMFRESADGFLPAFARSKKPQKSWIAMRKIALPIWILLAGSLSSALLHAQSVGGAQIAGVITDPSGAVVPDALVNAVQNNTGQIRTTTSASNGSYVLPNLAVGPYTLEVTGQGFGRYVNSGILLEV